MPATKEQIRQIIADNNLNSVADVYSLLKDSWIFRCVSAHFPENLSTKICSNKYLSLAYEEYWKVVLV